MQEFFDNDSDNRLIDWQELREYIHAAGGGLIYPVPSDSTSVYPENDNDLCRLITSNPQGLNRCKAIHKLHLSEIQKLLRPTLFRCHAGFWNIAIPLLNDDEYIGAVLGCGILDHTRKTIDYGTLAQEIKEDPEELIAAVRRVPLLSKAKIQSIRSLLTLTLQELINQKSVIAYLMKKGIHYDRVVTLFNGLYRVYKEMRNTNDFDTLKANLLRIVEESTQSDAVLIYLNDEEKKPVLMEASALYASSIGKLYVSKKILEEALVNSEHKKIRGLPLNVVDELEEVSSIIKLTDYQSRQLLPMIGQKSVIGCLELLSNSPKAYDMNDKQMNTFLTNLASQLGIALENALLRRQTELLSVTDEMTGLYNFRYFSQKLKEEVTRCARYGHTLSLIMIDLDKFKDFNDTFGHPAGDEALRNLAVIMRNNIRDVDVAARYGGEEFSIILPETGPKEAEIIIERIREKVSTYNFVAKDHKKHRQLTISAGIASFSQDAKDMKELIDLADKALYYSKERGRNCVTYYRDIIQPY